MAPLRHLYCYDLGTCYCLGDLAKYLELCKVYRTLSEDDLEQPGTSEGRFFLGSEVKPGVLHRTPEFSGVGCKTWGFAFDPRIFWGRR